MSSLNHIAFIMDGNGRWAKAQGKPRLEGHRQGVKTLEKLLPALAKHKIECATFYAFSTENWKRPASEVTALMDILRWYFKNHLKKMIADGVRIQFIGDRSEGGKLPADVLKIMNDAEEKTASGKNLTAVFAINYGAQDELRRAAAQGGENLEEHLDTATLPALDALVRTGGEQRLSNFLLWQASYAELFFTDVFWPDFDEKELENIISSFCNRQRKFGELPQE